MMEYSEGSVGVDGVRLQTDRYYIHTSEHTPRLPHDNLDTVTK